MKKITNLSLFIIAVMWIIFLILFPTLNCQFVGWIIYIVLLIQFSVNFYFESKNEQEAHWTVLLTLVLAMITPTMKFVWEILDNFEIWNYKQMTEHYFKPYFEVNGSVVIGLIIYSLIIPFALFFGIVILNNKEEKSEEVVEEIAEEKK